MFKKIAAVNKSDSEPELETTKAKEPEEEKDAVKPTETTATVNNSAKRANASAPLADLEFEPAKSSVIRNMGEEDLFQEIKVDRAFTENTLKSAQKDRIKAAASDRKRAPTRPGY